MRLARLSIRLSGLQHDFPVEGPRRRDRHRDRTDPLDRGREGQQIAKVKRYGEARNALASDSLKVLQVTARDRRNVFEQLIEAVKYNSLGQISHALYDVGGEYRRNM